MESKKNARTTSEKPQPSKSQTTKQGKDTKTRNVGQIRESVLGNKASKKFASNSTHKSGNPSKRPVTETSNKEKNSKLVHKTIEKNISKDNIHSQKFQNVFEILPNDKGEVLSFSEVNMFKNILHLGPPEDSDRKHRFPDIADRAFPMIHEVDDIVQTYLTVENKRIYRARHRIKTLKKLHSKGQMNELAE